MQSTLRHDNTASPDHHYQAEGILELWHTMNSIADFVLSFQLANWRFHDTSVAAWLLETSARLLASSAHAPETRR
jgi:hypothetical protein